MVITRGKKGAATLGGKEGFSDYLLHSMGRSLINKTFFMVGDFYESP